MIIILGEYQTPAWIWNISLYAQNNLLLWSRQLRKVVTFGSREDRNHEVLLQGKSVLITRSRLLEHTYIGQDPREDKITTNLEKNFVRLQETGVGLTASIMANGILGSIREEDMLLLISTEPSFWTRRWSNQEEAEACVEWLRRLDLRRRYLFFRTTTHQPSRIIPFETFVLL